MTDRFLYIEFEQVYEEFISAVEKHGLHQTPNSLLMDDRDKLVILMEEVGEVARALTYDEGNRDELHSELIQVATMALAWANALSYQKVQ